MQISSPTQALNCPIESTPHDNSSVGSVEGDSTLWEYRAEKKDKPGIFAKLLEGLTGKGKNGPKTGEVSGPGMAETADEALFPGTEKAGENSLVRLFGPNGRVYTQKTRDSNLESPIGSEIPDGKGISGNFSVLNGQDLPLEQGLSRQNQADLRNSRFSRRDFSHSGTSSGEINPKEEGISELFAKKQVEKQISDLLSSRSEKGMAEATKNSGGDRARFSRNGGADSLLARHSEAGFSQSQAMLRPDLVSQARFAGGERENSRFSELRGKRGRERLSIEVRDLRTPADATSSNGVNSDLSKGTAFNALRPVHTEMELPVDLKLSVQRGDEPAAGKTGKESFQSRVFEDALARELRGNLSTDIVRDATLIVRNGGEGTIRLALRPASLGNVKIHLEMTENKITGHIIVESSEALRAFERELPALEKAFKESGFSETLLDMALQSEGWNFGAEQQQEGNFPALDPALAASRYDAGTELVEDPFIQDNAVLSGSPERKAVNILI